MQSARPYAGLSDRFWALPGGSRTCDELFEALPGLNWEFRTMSAGLLNVNCYYDSDDRMVDRYAGQGFKFAIPIVNCCSRTPMFRGFSIVGSRRPCSVEPHEREFSTVC